MKEQIAYQSYLGDEPFIFLRFDRTDRQAASRIINRLIERQFRVSYNERDNKTVADSEEVAERILSSHMIIFLLSSEALKSLEFRNSINYALDKKKKVFCIYLDEKKPGYGFDMQLANVPGVKLGNYKDYTELCGDIVMTDGFLQIMRTDDARIPIKNSLKKNVAITVIAVVLVVFLVAAAVIAVYRINYDNSLVGQIEKITETDYLDISNQDASLIELLKGKTIKTLDARNMGLTDIEALGLVNCEILDISRNPNVTTLEPLLYNKYLQVVRVTQDMYSAIIMVSGRHQFKIVITG